MSEQIDYQAIKDSVASIQKAVSDMKQVLPERIILLALKDATGYCFRDLRIVIEGIEALEDYFVLPNNPTGE